MCRSETLYFFILQFRLGICAFAAEVYEQYAAGDDARHKDFHNAGTPSLGEGDIAADNIEEQGNQCADAVCGCQIVFHKITSLEKYRLSFCFSEISFMYLY